jgi:excisionase family DNA binding protein
LLDPVTIKLDGLEAHIERVVTEKVEAALASRDGDKWLTSDEAAAYLGIARSTLHDLVCEGRLPRHGEKGHRLRFRRDDLDRYAQRRD